MNEKITLPGLIQLLAIHSGTSKKQSEDFIKEFFNTISGELAEGEMVKIKEFGVFKTIAVEPRKSVNVSTGEENEIPAHRKVVFVPAKEIAQVVNEPFEMFETVELNGDDIEEIEETDEKEVSKVIADADNSEETIPVEDEIQGEESGITSDLDPESESDPEPYPEPDVLNPTAEGTQIIAEEPEPHPTETESERIDHAEESVLYDSTADADVVPVEEPVSKEESNKSYTIYETPEDTTESNLESCEEPEQLQATRKRQSKFGIGFLSGFALAAVLCGIAWWFVNEYVDSDFLRRLRMNSREERLYDVRMQAKADSVENAIKSSQTVVVKNEQDSVESAAKPGNSSEREDVAMTAASDQKEYDTISKTRYLTTMAKDHYGNYNLWPYIYMENKSFLGHPDRIKPGTQVVIPSLSKYGVDANNPDDIAKAKKLGVEIYAKYK